MAIKRSPLSPEEVEARRRNARQSTGPRPEAGQRVSSPQALRYGSHWERQVNMMIDLDENPFEYVTLCDSLVESLRPTHAAQRMVVEQIAMWRWQERRAVRAQVARQALSVEHLKLERHRRALEISHDVCDATPEEVAEHGLLRVPDSPAKFGQLLEYLDLLLDAAELRDFNGMELILQAIYGKTLTLRGNELMNLLHSLTGAAEPEDAPERSADTPAPGEAKPEAGPESRPGSSAEIRALQLRQAVRAEIGAVTEQYKLYLREHVEVSAARFDACLAPAGGEDQRLLMRERATCSREIVRNIRLLLEMQKVDRDAEARPTPENTADPRPRDRYGRFLPEAPLAPGSGNGGAGPPPGGPAVETGPAASGP